LKADGICPADRKARALAAVVVSALLASCTTSGPGFNIASPSYNSGGIASVMAEVAQSEAGAGAAAASASASLDAANGEASPEQVAQLPDASPTAESAQETQAAAAESSATIAAGDSAPETQTTTLAATEEEEAGQSAAVEPAAAAAATKRSFLASLFARPPAQKAPAAKTAFAPAQTPVASVVTEKPEAEAKPLIDLSSKEQPVKLASFGGDALPGVRQTTNLFEITHKSGIEDNSDVDLYEGEDAPVVLASAAGLARLAPNGLLTQRESVDVACLKPELVRLLKTVERHFGKRMVITSGYRSPAYNRKVRGAERSQHMYCAAADVQIPGVSKWEIAKLVRSMPGRGGVGTYCHTHSVHIDVGPERDWNWRCRS
jgi:uncharacterized protein YcbK (DUF882 family)